MGEFADLNDPGPAQHIPVLLQEILDGLALRPGGRYLDATVGGGGHAVAILTAAGPEGRLLGLDRDPEAAERAAQRLADFGTRAQVVHASYVDLGNRAAQAQILPLDGVLFDLGFSSWQVDDPRRGFSWRLDGPLDMRFDPGGAEEPASTLVNTLTEAALADLLWRYGEEPRSRRIAAAIVAARPIESAPHLVNVILKAIGRAPRERIHPATRAFQALRIAVNDELAGLEAALPQAVAALRPGGRLAVITFHSLEDRIVKHFFKAAAGACTCPPTAPICTCGRQAQVRGVTRKPLTPSAAEIAANPRSRSAKLRIVEKL